MHLNSGIPFARRHDNLPYDRGDNCKDLLVESTVIATLFRFAGEKPLDMTNCAGI